MGIKGLLPFVKNACRPGNIEEFSGQSIAVDVSCLLHRGVFGCIEKIVRGQETDFYIEYVKKYVQTLLTHGCHVILVFDGQPLPAKKNINDERRARREKNNKLGHQMLKQGLTSEAHKVFRQSTTVTREQVDRTIEAFRGWDRVDVLVAPYEADAQMAFLMQSGLASAVVTEDSDLIPFGCSKIIFKLDVDGTCLVFDNSLLPRCLCPGISREYNFEVFRRICILAGCDYLQGGLQGVGLKKAETFFARTSSKDLRKSLPRVPLYLKLSIKITKEFIEDFIRAERTFLHQIVFDPVSRQHRPLNPYPEDIADALEYAYAGEALPDDVAMQMALGNATEGNGSDTSAFTLSDNVPSWSIWHPKDAQERAVLREINNESAVSTPSNSKRVREETRQDRDDSSPQLKKSRADMTMTRKTKWIEQSFSASSTARPRLSHGLELATERRVSNGSLLSTSSSSWLERYGRKSFTRESSTERSVVSQASSGYFSKTSQESSSLSSGNGTQNSARSTPTQSTPPMPSAKNGIQHASSVLRTPTQASAAKAVEFQLLPETPPMKKPTAKFEELPETPPAPSRKKADVELLPETPPRSATNKDEKTLVVHGTVKASGSRSGYFSEQRTSTAQRSGSGRDLWSNTLLARRSSVATTKFEALTSRTKF